MKRMSSCLAVVILALGVPLLGQGPGVMKILSDARAALGGEKKLAAFRTLAATGQSVRVTANGSSAPVDFEMAFELPDKFMKKDVMAMMGGSAITRTSGFNGETAIEVIDQPPAMPGVIRIVRGPGGDPNAPQTPEQQEQNRKNALIAAKQDFSRLLLGLLASSSPAYPIEFSYGGVAESPDSKADIIDAKGEGGFAARLFIDQKTHLPLMLSWMAKEPLVISRTFTGGKPGAGPPPGGAGAHAQAAMPEERDKMVKQAQEQVKEAEAKLRVVEYRLYYGDYREVDGIKVPFRLQRAIDGKPTEEVTLEKVKINGKIDPKKFEAK
jgi:hypothetical protein